MMVEDSNCLCVVCASMDRPVACDENHNIASCQHGNRSKAVNILQVCNSDGFKQVGWQQQVLFRQSGRAGCQAAWCQA